MKQKLIYYLSILFLLFSAGAGITIFYTHSITSNLQSIIDLHRIESMRQNLVINTQIVQTNLHAIGTAFGKELDVIVDNVTALDKSIQSCKGCHHGQDMTARLQKTAVIVEQYKDALSFLITTTANQERIDRLKAVAVEIGDLLLSETMEMTFIAEKTLSNKTLDTLKDIKKTRFILIITLIFAFAIAIIIAVRLTKQITEPVYELASAARKVAMGDLGYTISYKDDTEFGELAANFNNMSLALKEGFENVRNQQLKIAESEWKFRTVSEFAYDWEYWIKEDMEIIFMSPSCERITGYSHEEFIDNPYLFAKIIHPDDVDTYNKHLENFRRPKSELEFRIITKSGELKWLSHLCSPIFVEDKFLGRRISSRDITDRKRLEEQLIQAQKMESLGLLAGGVAHDFNNLLTVIYGYSIMLQNSLKGDDANLKDYSDKIIAASEQAQNLTSSLLAFSRKQIISPSVISLSNIVKKISLLMDRLIGEDIELIIKYPENEGDNPVFADGHQIEQVVMNLLANAKDAMPRGGILTIEIAPVTLGADFTEHPGVKPGKYMKLVVSDTGEGIDKHALPHIFEPFFTTKDMGKGTGLGLSMVYGIIKQHGGFINVYSEKGMGTTFKIYLPVSDEYAASALKKTGVPLRDIDLRGDETILIAEDERLVRTFLQDIIKSYGYNVITAENGDDAITKFEENNEQVDLVILDVIMPLKNGKEVFQHIRQKKPSVKAIFLSGYTQDILTSKGIYEEGLQFISKPPDIQELMEKIRSSLNN